MKNFLSIHINERRDAGRAKNPQRVNSTYYKTKISESSNKRKSEMKIYLDSKGLRWATLFLVILALTVITNDSEIMRYYDSGYRITSASRLDDKTPTTEKITKPSILGGVEHEINTTDLNFEANQSQIVIFTGCYSRQEKCAVPSSSLCKSTSKKKLNH